MSSPKTLSVQTSSNDSNGHDGNNISGNGGSGGSGAPDSASEAARILRQTAAALLASADKLDSLSASVTAPAATITAAATESASPPPVLASLSSDGLMDDMEQLSLGGWHSTTTTRAGSPMPAPAFTHLEPFGCALSPAYRASDGFRLAIALLNYALGELAPSNISSIGSTVGNLSERRWDQALSAESLHAPSRQLNWRRGRLASSGRIVFSAVGKSGHIATKIAATLSSLGCPAIFVHATEMLHGDMGRIVPGQDALVLLSQSGETAEVVAVANEIRSWMGSAMSGNGVGHGEAHERIPAPTVSTTLALATGDALAIALAKQRGVTKDDFARFHPGGALGRALSSNAPTPRLTAVRVSSERSASAMGSPLVRSVSETAPALASTKLKEYLPSFAQNSPSS
ncbi:SIS domain-containing protein [Ramicandelaber brevisporus]|nr:SIS domain-containing protein [Ramicandelaber brevisporus]